MPGAGARAPLGLLAAVLLGGALTGHALAGGKAFLSANGTWLADGNWMPSGQPLKTDDVTINAGGGLLKICTLAAGNAGHASTLLVGDFGRSRLDLYGNLTVGHDVTLGKSIGGDGAINLRGGALLVAGGTVYVGDASSGSMLLEDSSMTSNRMVLANRANGIYLSGVIQSSTPEKFSTNTVNGDLVIGGGATGASYQASGAGSVVQAHRLLLGATGFSGSGTMTLNSGALFRLRDGATIGGSTAAVPFTGVLTNNGGMISSSGEGPAEVIVNGPKAKLLGTGTFNTGVTFTSGDVTLRFDPELLTTSSRYLVSAGLTYNNVGATPGNLAEKATAMEGQMLSGSAFRVRWDPSNKPNPNAPPATIPTLGGIEFDTPKYTGEPGGSISIEVPFAPAGVAAIDGIPAANLIPRLALTQFGQRISVNYGSTIIPGPDVHEASEIRTLPSVADGPGGRMKAEWPNVTSDFEVGINRGVSPKHQDPNIQQLHDGTRVPAGRKLTGDQVVMGFVESGRPDRTHGAFDDFASPDPAAYRLQHVGLDAPPDLDETSRHATLVASIMAGYDPFGIQVDGLSRFGPADQRYNNGFGFVGVAPGARLHAASANTDDSVRAALLDLAAVDDMKVINSSMFVKGPLFPPGPPPPATGDGLTELAIDQLIASRQIVFTQIAGNFGEFPQSLARYAGIYNGIVVANAEFNYDSQAGASNLHPTHFDKDHAELHRSSGIGPTDESNPRSAPHLAAQGTANLGAFRMVFQDSARSESPADPAYPLASNRHLYSTMTRLDRTRQEVTYGTSFAAPTVAGVAALMIEEARALYPEGPERHAAEHPLVIKSILMTSADKPSSWEKGELGLSTDNDSAHPLSYDWGAGLMNPVHAVQLLEAGRLQFSSAINQGGIATPGWDRDRVSDTPSPYPRDLRGAINGNVYLLRGVAPGPLTATFTWLRHVSGTHPALTGEELSNLMLSLYQWDGKNAILVSDSDAPFDNTEHIHLNAVAGGDYLLNVVPKVLAAGRSSELYGLSWSFTPKPDTDRDGMPDDYEDAHGLDKTVDDSLLDLDGDGLDNISEYNQYTNPTLSSDPDGDDDDWLFDMEASGNDLVLTWESRAGETYIVRSSTELSAGGAEGPVAWPIHDGHAGLVSTPPLNTLTIPRPAEAQRFFVLEALPAPPH